MAPHPVVQAIIDLSAGAVGKLFYLHFHCIITFYSLISTGSRCFLHLPAFPVFSPVLVGPRLPSSFWWLCFPLHFFQFLLTLAAAYWSHSYKKGFLWSKSWLAFLDSSHFLVRSLLWGHLIYFLFLNPVILVCAHWSVLGWYSSLI